jgi:hypothetical protein
MKQNNILVLPVENVVLVAAFGKHTNKIRKQILIEFKIGEDKFEGVFMISPQLTNDAIIGCQLLNEYEINIQFGKGTISYLRDGIHKQVKFNQEQIKEQESNSKLFNLQKIIHTPEKQIESEWDKTKV